MSILIVFYYVQEKLFIGSYSSSTEYNDDVCVVDSRVGFAIVFLFYVAAVVDFCGDSRVANVCDNAAACFYHRLPTVEVPVFPFQETCDAWATGGVSAIIPEQL